KPAHFTGHCPFRILGKRRPTAARAPGGARNLRVSRIHSAPARRRSPPATRRPLAMLFRGSPGRHHWSIMFSNLPHATRLLLIVIVVMFGLQQIWPDEMLAWFGLWPDVGPILVGRAAGAPVYAEFAP